MSIKGIDVSYHNGVIDWGKVAKDGIKFAVLREGYRKTIDTQFLANVSGALANHIPVMVYHFIYTDGATIKENAVSTVNNLKKAGLDPATTFIWADLEYDTWKKNGESCTKTKCTQYTQEYIDALKSLGCKKIGVYMNNDYYKNYYSSEIISKYPIWLADYSGGADHPCSIHQYSSTGNVAGINSNSVDCNYLMDESILSSTTKGGNVMTESQLRQKVADFLTKFMGIREGSAEHKKILAYFNDSGFSTRYRMTTNDAWCATTVSAVFIALGLAGKSGSGKLFECCECSCYYMIELAKKQGIWVENDAYVPKTGDVILYDWQDTTGSSSDNQGNPDHVGIVTSCDGTNIHVIEGNISNTVGTRTLKVNGKYIRGFIAPKYSKFTSAGTTPVTPTPAPILTVTKPASGTSFNKTCKFKGITTSDLNVRKGAGIDWEKCSFSPLKKDTVVEVCDTCSNGWYYIKYDGKYGFCSNEYIIKKESTSTPVNSGGLNRTPKWVGSVTADVLNVRTWAGTENPNIKSYPKLGKGNLIDVCDSVKDTKGDVWYYIRIAGKIYGFVHSAYIKAC